MSRGMPRSWRICTEGIPAAPSAALAAGHLTLERFGALCMVLHALPGRMWIYRLWAPTITCRGASILRMPLQVPKGLLRSTKTDTCVLQHMLASHILLRHACSVLRAQSQTLALEVRRASSSSSSSGSPGTLFRGQ